MILDNITLHNFGAYAGRQEARLSPDPGKPIILFGGMNGGGKTTLLDAIQLCFYGKRATLSNRNRSSYRAYLRDCIHQGLPTADSASVTLDFRRLVEGQTRSFRLQRAWTTHGDEIQENFSVWQDEKADSVSTEHWEEIIEAYLPSSIAHLFFFDGEQVKDLAEGVNTASILGTAVHSLLGLDLVGRLEGDLKVFERRKRASVVDSDTLHEFKRLQAESEHLDSAVENALMEEGALVNETGRLAKDLRGIEDHFHAEGGDLFLRRREIEHALSDLRLQKQSLHNQLRGVTAGLLPLLVTAPLLAEIEQQLTNETKIRRAKVLIDELESRDRAILSALAQDDLPSDILKAIDDRLCCDRAARADLAEGALLYDAGDTLPLQISHLRKELLPAAHRHALEYVEKLQDVEERIVRIEDEIQRVPSEDSLASIMESLKEAQTCYQAKIGALEAVRLRLQGLRNQHQIIENQLERVAHRHVDARLAEDDRERMLKHSQKVRETLALFRKRIVLKHTKRIESLVLECFQRLLRKSTLVSQINIDPITFAPTLTGSNGQLLPIDRLSAGERQLLATSMIWGLARASGRPVPTLIDTPLGRLDSSHRRHLVERYFPNASHQVLLFSTDEEIVGQYHSALEPFITRSYLLLHDEQAGRTDIKSGYFC